MSVLSRIAGVDVRNMQKMWSTVIAKKFTTDDANMLYNIRLEKTRQAQLNYIESQREKGIKGAEKRWSQPMAVAKDGVQPNDSSSSSSSSSSSKKKKDIYILASKVFDAWWYKYPHRNGKKITKSECVSLMKQIRFESWDDLMKATENYGKSAEATRGYSKDPIRFLKKGYWKDWVNADFSPDEKDDEDVRQINENLRRMKENRDG
jgi:hypothetical protein